MNQSLLFIWLLFSMSQAVGQIKLGDRTIDRIDSIITALEQKHSPGGAISIVLGNKVVYERCFGLENIKDKKPISPATAFNLASVSKQFTGMCIALLEEQGKLSLSNDITMYFPQFQLPDTIRIKNLLDHSSGIREAAVLAVLAGHVNLKGELPGKRLDKDFLFEVLSQERELNFPTGSESAYTNINYVLLADIVAQTSGMPFKEFADSAIFKPLQMRHTYVEDFQNKSEVVGYAKKNKRFKKRVLKNGLVGEDNIVSTLDDLYKWNQNFRDNKLGKQSQALIDKITTSSLLSDGTKSRFGYRLYISEREEMKVVSHDGENDIHTSFLLSIPSQDFEIVFLVNSIDHINPIRKTYEILDLMLDSKIANNKKSIPPITQLGSKDLFRLTGTYYRLSENGTAKLRKVTINDDKLAVAFSSKGKAFPFETLSATNFVRYNSSGHPIYLSFNTTDEKVTFIEQFSEGPWKHEDWLFQKVVGVPAEVKEYRGIYRETQHGIKVKIGGTKEKLVAKKSIIRIPTTLLKADLFYSSEYDALFSFERNKSGEIESLKISSSDFRNFTLWKK